MQVINSASPDTVTTVDKPIIDIRAGQSCHLGRPRARRSNGRGVKTLMNAVILYMSSE
jgi:hypothetical protein